MRCGAHFNATDHDGYLNTVSTMLARLSGILLLPIILVGLVWFGVVIYFQQTGHDIDGRGLVEWFVALPLAVVASWYLLRFLFRKLTQPRTQAIAPATTDVSAATQKETRDASQHFELAILAAEFHTAAGDDAEALLAGIKEGEIQPALSSTETDREGLPVKLLRDDGLETTGAREWINHYLATHPASIREAEMDQAVRLIALLASPLAGAIDVIARLPSLATSGHALQSNGAGKGDAARRPVVTKILAPEDWHELIANYVRDQLAALPQIAFGLVRADANRPELQQDALRVADAFCAGSESTYANATLLLLACDSLVSTAQIAALDTRDLLFAAHNQQGLVPGEAAAVIVAVPHKQVTEETPPLARLHRANFGTRQKPVDAGGRVDAQDIQHLASLSLERASQTPDQIGTLISDCDHRSAWQTEAAMLIGSLLPELDPVADHFAIGNSLGHTGQAQTTLAFALAAHQVSIEDHPVLLASMTDPRNRSLVVLSPWQVAPAATS